MTPAMQTSRQGAGWQWWHLLGKDREKIGRSPACVEACKVGALTYGEWQEE